MGSCVTEFAVRVQTTSSRCVLAVSGEIDLSVSAHLADIVIDCASRTDASDIVIDLSGVSFIDSTGLGALITIRLAARERGQRLVLQSPTPHVAEVLAITGLDHVLEIETADDVRAESVIVGPSDERAVGRH
jgi:anti-anti-sigma factor